MALGKLLQGFGTGAQAASAETMPGKNAVNANSPDRLRILDEFEQAGIGWIWATDAEANLIYLSQGAIDALDIDPSNLFGQSMASLFSGNGSTDWR